jgi:hypothetical protein
MFSFFTIGDELDSKQTNRTELHYDGVTQDTMLNFASELIEDLESDSVLDFELFNTFQNLKDYMVTYEKNTLTYSNYSFKIHNNFLTITKTEVVL